MKTTRRQQRVLLFPAIMMVAVASACTSVPQQLDPEKFYRHDLRLEVNGVRGTGVMVLPRSHRYRIHGESVGQLDLLTISSCHREFSAERQGTEFDYDYAPLPGIETGGGCPLHFGGYEQKKGRHTWGIVDFEGPDATLPATLQCNGQVVRSNGVSICQSRAGLYQTIEFPGSVDVSPDPDCPMPLGGRPGLYEFPLARGECVYAFREQAEPNRIHRLTTLGYEGILIREE